MVTAIVHEEEPAWGYLVGKVRRSRRTHRAETQKLNLGHTLCHAFVTVTVAVHKKVTNHHYTHKHAPTHNLFQIQARGQTLHSFLRPLDLLSLLPFPIKIREALMAPTGSLARPI